MIAMCMRPVVEDDVDSGESVETFCDYTSVSGLLASAVSEKIEVSHLCNSQTTELH